MLSHTWSHERRWHGHRCKVFNMEKKKMEMDVARRKIPKAMLYA